MTEVDYIPDRGDIIWLEFNPQSGHEQKGRRPALVLSPIQYNSKAGIALICPITSQIKNYPFEVSLPEKFKINGVVISDQVKSLDWKVRKAEFITKAPHNVIVESIKKLSLILKI